MPVSPARSLAQRAAWLRLRANFRDELNRRSLSVAALRSVLSAFDRTAFQNAADPLLPTEAALGGDDESSVFGLLERHGAADAADFLRTAVAEAAAARREVDEDGSVQILSTSDGLYSVVWRSVARRDDNRTAFTVSGTRLEWLRSVFRGEPAAFEPSLFAMLARYDAVSEAGAGAQAAVPAGVYRAFHQAWPREAEVGEAVVEGFASPLNHQLVAARRVDFGTAFADTDAPFGGVGPFETHADALCSNSPHTLLLLNPPFGPREMLAMSHRLERTLARADGATSALVAVPSLEARGGTPPHLAALEASPHLVGEPLRLGAGEHAYVDGRAHRMTRRKTIRAARHESVVLLLSSHPAARGAAGAVLGAVRDSFRSAVDSG